MIMEGRNLVTKRYHFSEKDFVTISDLTSLLFLGAVGLIILNYDPTGFLGITAGWLPLLLSPLIAAQLYSTGDTITIGTRLGKKKKVYTHKPLDFRFYFMAVCLFAAATGNSRSFSFYLMLSAIVAVLLFANRGRSYSIPVFAAFLSLSLILGFFGSVAMEQGHGYVLRKSFRFLYKYYREQHSNPYKTHVNFGDTGRMKNSGEIIMRVASISTPPYLFREAVYTTFQKGDWFADQGGYEFVTQEGNERRHLFEAPDKEGKSLTVELPLPREKGLLPAPAGAYRLTSATIFELERHSNGTIRIVDGAKIVTYEIAYHLKPENVDNPGWKNLVVPEEERYALEAVKDKLETAGMSSEAKVAAVRGFFADGFSYSLDLLGRGEQATALGNFLLIQKRGFCEYYATSTTLLLRSLGIPSRYAIGYAVHEKSALEDKYLVRGRHGHAWAEAYVDGAWVAVDTTPPEWFALDAEQGSLFEKMYDIFDLVRHKYRLFQIGSGRDYTLLFSIIVVILTVILVFRIYRRLKLERATEKKEAMGTRRFSRIITPFTPIIDSLADLGLRRRKNESFTEWAQRSRSWGEFDEEEFDSLYNLHLRLRFDPDESRGKQWGVLQRGVEKYIKNLEGDR
jgi:hypothetical protein